MGIAEMLPIIKSELTEEDFMKHECKITVLETKFFPELQEKYLADPKSGPSPFFKALDIGRNVVKNSINRLNGQ